MATEGKTPLKDAASSSPQGTKKAADRSKVSRNRIIAGVVGAVIVLGGIFLLTRNGNGPLGGGNDVPPGKVDFQTKGVTVVPWQLHGDQNAQKTTAHAAAEDIRKQLDSLFDASYVDPDTWGDTGEIEDFFTGGAKDQLDGDVSTLTLGENAGDTYTSVDPRKSTIKVSVLTDAKGSATRASATLSFTGFATHTDGTFSAISVTGTAIFVQDGGTWKIEAYRLKRSEKPAKAPTASSSPTSEAS